MAMQCTAIVAQYTIRHWQLNWRRQRQKIWWRICVKKWEVATMSDILMTFSVCGWISWNNRANNWPASLLQHCACTNSTPGDWARRTEQVLEQANAAILPSSLELDSLVHLISREIWSIFSSRGKFWLLMKWVELEALTRYALLVPSDASKLSHTLCICIELTHPLLSDMIQNAGKPNLNVIAVHWCWSTELSVQHSALTVLSAH